MGPTAPTSAAQANCSGNQFQSIRHQESDKLPLKTPNRCFLLGQSRAGGGERGAGVLLQ